MLRMVSVAALVECKEHVSRVQRVLSVGVTDRSSLTGMAVGGCATVLLLTATGLGLFVQ